MFKKGIATTALATGVVISSAAFVGGAKVMWGDNLGTFTKAALKNPFQVGALSPCSTFVAKEITKHIPEQSNHALRVLEVGAGSGVLTREIVKKLDGKEYQFDVVEISPDFCKSLTKEFSGKPGVKVYQEDITKWNDDQKYDIIVSALPFNVFEDTAIKKILGKYEKMLKENGHLSYVELAGLPKIKKFFSSKKTVEEFEKKLAIVQEFKEKYLEQTVKINLNVPPLYVHHLKI